MYFLFCLYICIKKTTYYLFVSFKEMVVDFLSLLAFVFISPFIILFSIFKENKDKLIKSLKAERLKFKRKELKKCLTNMKQDSGKIEDYLDKIYKSSVEKVTREMKSIKRDEQEHFSSILLNNESIYFKKFNDGHFKQCVFISFLCLLFEDIGIKADYKEIEGLNSDIISKISYYYVRDRGNQNSDIMINLFEEFLGIPKSYMEKQFIKGIKSEKISDLEIEEIGQFRVAHIKGENTWYLMNPLLNENFMKPILNYQFDERKTFPIFNDRHVFGYNRNSGE